MKPMLDKLALILTIIGGINWGLIGIFQFDLVAWICGRPGLYHQPDYLHDCGAGGHLVHSLLFRDHDTVTEAHHA